MAGTKEKKEAKPAATESAGSPQLSQKKEKKVSRWTQETCKKSALRFQTRQDWSVGHPSSYKAAVAKGWDTACCAHMTKVASVTKVTAKKAAVKAPARLPKSA